MTTMSATKTTILDPDSKPKLKEINKCVKPFTVDKWYDIGLELGVGESDELEDGEFLDGIKSSCGENEEKCFMEMIKTWVRSASDSSEVTWRRLLHCLRELGLQEAVKCVEDNLESPTSTKKSQPISHDSSQQSDQTEPGNEEHLLNENSTSTQTVQSDSQLESRDEPQKTAPMVPLFIDPSDAVPTELVPNQATPGSVANSPSQLQERSSTQVDQSSMDEKISTQVIQSEAPMKEAPDSSEVATSGEPTNELSSTDNSANTTAASESSTNGHNESGQQEDLKAAECIISSGIPDSIDGSLLPECASAPLTSNYELVLEEGREIRGYQKELAQPGIEGKNYIVVAPTGSGKTLVAALVISEHLQKGKESDKEKTRRVIFIVDKKPLAQQQTKELDRLIPSAKVTCCIGDDTTNTLTSCLESGVHIIVCTAGKLVDDMKNGRISLSEFSLMIFDECHHTRKKSPYAAVMIRYIQNKRDGKKLPQVMGMTASPGAGDNPHLEKTVTIDHLVKLCALMDATGGIKTVRENKPELEEHTNKPGYNLENSKSRNLSEPFITKIIEMMEKLEERVGFTCPFDRWDQKYETQVQQKKFVLEKSMSPDSRNEIRIWELLRCLNRTLDVYMELQFKDAISVLECSEICKLNIFNEKEEELLHSLNTLLSQLKILPRVSNPHLERVKTLLAESFESEPNTRAMLFVRTKKHASSIFNWIKSLPLAKQLGIRPCMVVGQVAGTTGDGMTQAEQESSFQSFRDGKSNLLVVTSIGEEGIDVPACNLVIRYQHMSNEIAKAQTLGRARATGMSEGFTVLSSSKKQMQEVKNGELLALVDKILLDQHFPSGQFLETQIEEDQKQLLKKAELEKARIDEKRSTYQVEDVNLFCVKCKTKACCAADIRVINGTMHVVPGKEFKEKTVEVGHEKPIHKAAMNITRRIQCKSCQQHWGVSCIWPNSGNQFPVLSCKSFTFVVLEEPISVKKWSEAPFTVKEFDEFPKPADDDTD